jgi:hypothetical protein
MLSSSPLHGHELQQNPTTVQSTPGLLLFKKYGMFTRHCVAAILSPLLPQHKSFEKSFLFRTILNKSLHSDIRTYIFVYLLWCFFGNPSLKDRVSCEVVYRYVDQMSFKEVVDWTVLPQSTPRELHCKRRSIEVLAVRCRSYLLPLPTKD